jgi:hypothetical protein
VRVVTEQLSVYVALGTDTEALQLPDPVFSVIGAGQVITGFSVSLVNKEYFIELPMQLPLSSVS